MRHSSLGLADPGCRSKYFRLSCMARHGKKVVDRMSSGRRCLLDRDPRTRQSVLLN